MSEEVIFTLMTTPKIDSTYYDNVVRYVLEGLRW